MIRERSKRCQPQPDMTPMVDVTFLLLVFFLISASFVSQAALPADTMPSGFVGSKCRPVTVEVGATNEIWVETQSVGSVEELRNALEDEMDELATSTVLIDASPESLHEATIKVIDAATAAKATRIQMKLAATPVASRK